MVKNIFTMIVCQYSNIAIDVLSYSVYWKIISNAFNFRVFIKGLNVSNEKD